MGGRRYSHDRLFADNSRRSMRLFMEQVALRLRDLEPGGEPAWLAA
jgi:hypothetical protein